MRSIEKFLILGVNLPLLLTVAGAADFATIAQKNVFRLSSLKSQSQPEEAKPELSDVVLQGVTTLLDKRQALLKIQTAAKVPATNVCCILDEGQARDGVKVLRIDMESGTVWVANQGVEQVLLLRR